MTEPMVPLLTVKEVARRLGVNVGRVYALVNDGALPAFRLGQRVIRIAPADLEAFIERSKRISAAKALAPRNRFGTLNTGPRTERRKRLWNPDRYLDAIERNIDREYEDPLAGTGFEGS